MFKIILVFVLSLSLLGCATPKFQVVKKDNRFEEVKKDVFFSRNNRISTKSVAGGMHIDSNGVYLNPFVEKSLSGEVEVLGFDVVNMADFNTMAGDVNQLGILKKVVFEVGGNKLISLDVGAQEIETSGHVSFNSVGNYASYDKWETGKVVLSIDQMSLLANAGSISCKITGTKRSVVYDVEDIAPAFISNIKSFFLQYVRQG